MPLFLKLVLVILGVVSLAMALPQSGWCTCVAGSYGAWCGSGGLKQDALEGTLCNQDELYTCNGGGQPT